MNNKFYKYNREKLINSIKDEKCMIVLSSGYEVTKSADENFDFEVNTNFFYLTGINQAHVNLIILKENDEYQEILYIDEYSEFYEQWIGHLLTKQEASKASGVFKSNVEYKGYFIEDIIFFLEQYKCVYLDLEKNDNVNFNSFGLSLKETIEKDYDDVIIKDIYEDIVRLRMSKQKCEIKKLLTAIDNTKQGIYEMMKQAKPEMFEYELEAYFDFTIKTLGNKKNSFKTIAASGINATTMHYSSNDSIMNDGDLVLFDLGCKEEGYCADISRTFPVNGKFSKLQRKIYQIVLNANKEIIKKAHAGMTLVELQEICVNSLAEGCLKAKLISNKEEIKKYYVHGVSHSIGLDTHDPYLRNEPLPVGAVISDEPGLYFKEYNIGIRIEDDLYLLEDRAINLSKGIIKEIKDIELFMKK